MHGPSAVATSDDGCAFRWLLLEIVMVKRHIAIAITVLTVSVGGGVAAYYAYRAGKNVIHNAYATWWVAGMVVQHMDANSGEWPADWDALRDDYQTCVNRAGQPWTFEELRDRVAVNWSADPKQLLLDTDGSDVARFRVIWLRDGTDSHWEHREPNQIILDYLRSQGTQDGQQRTSAEFGIHAQSH